MRGDRPARAGKPVIKVADLAWLEFEKPDLAAAELATQMRDEQQSVVGVEGGVVEAGAVAGQGQLTDRPS